MNFEMTMSIDNGNYNMNLGVTEALKGKDGADGKDGENGLSAYEVALKNGFQGTEQEWLESLKGADGKDGENGKDGESYDDTELSNRVSALEATIGTLNDELEEVLSGNGE